MLAQARRGGCRSEKATKRCLEGLCGRYGEIASGVLATQTIVCGRALLSHSTDPSALLHGVGCLGALLRSVRISGRARTRGDGAGMRCSCLGMFCTRGLAAWICRWEVAWRHSEGLLHGQQGGAASMCVCGSALKAAGSSSFSSRRAWCTYVGAWSWLGAEAVRSLGRHFSGLFSVV